MSVVYFIRHGQSTSNAGQPTDHPASILLTDSGLEQARLSSQVFTRQPDLIVTSAFIRTKFTANPLLERFPQTPQAEWPVQEFTYMNPANWQGTTIEQRTPMARAFWERNDPHYRDEGGAESFADLIERVDNVRKMIAQAPGEEIAVFSHGMFSRVFIWRVMLPHLPVNRESMRRCVQFARGIPFPNCCIVKIRFEDGQAWVSGPDTGHLPEELITY